MTVETDILDIYVKRIHGKVEEDIRILFFLTHGPTHTHTHAHTHTHSRHPVKALKNDQNTTKIKS